MAITWDPDKDALNQHKHGITFSEAAALFALPDWQRFTAYDDTHSVDDEDRWCSIGMIARGVVVVIHTMRGDHDDDIRIISARRATRDETALLLHHLAGDMP